MPRKTCFKLESVSAGQTKKIGEILSGWLTRNRSPKILFISGDLGAGKTFFTKGLAKGLGIKKNILSPSFVLLRSYRGRSNWQLNHIDAYRLSPKEAKIFNWRELSKAGSITVVEWPEKIKGRLPKPSLKIKISHQNPTTRVLDLPKEIEKYVARFINRR